MVVKEAFLEVSPDGTVSPDFFGLLIGAYVSFIEFGRICSSQ